MPRPLLPLAFFFITSCLGCAALTPGLQTADTVLKGVCGAVVGAPTQEALASLEAGQKALMAQVVGLAAKNADPKIIRALEEALAATSATRRALAEQVLALASQAGPPAPAAKCPVEVPASAP